VLVDHGGAGGAVAHPAHKFPQAGTCHSGKVVAGMAQIVNVEAGKSRPWTRGPLTWIRRR